MLALQCVNHISSLTLIRNKVTGHLFPPDVFCSILLHTNTHTHSHWKQSWHDTGIFKEWKQNHVIISGALHYNVLMLTRRSVWEHVFRFLCDHSLLSVVSTTNICGHEMEIHLIQFLKCMLWILLWMIHNQNVITRSSKTTDLVHLNPAPFLQSTSSSHSD